MHIYNSKGHFNKSIISHGFGKEQEIVLLTVSITLLNVKPPNECPQETTMASSRNVPLKHRELKKEKQSFSDTNIFMPIFLQD